MMYYLPSRKASEVLNVHPNTLRSWAKQGKIDHIVTETGQRRYNIAKLLGKPSSYTGVCYCRVSSPKQRDDLERQAEYLRNRYPNHEFIKDVGSAINGKRKGLRSLLSRVLAGEKLEVVVSQRSSLAQLNFDLFEWLIEQNGGRVIVLNQSVHNAEAELAADLLTVLHSFLRGSKIPEPELPSQESPVFEFQRPPTADLPSTEAGSEHTVADLIKYVKACLLRNEPVPNYREVLETDKISITISEMPETALLA
jgi:predicted site-specific integrase-resolvase